MYKFVWKIENFTNLKGEPLLSPNLQLCNFLKLHNSHLDVGQLSITQGHSEIIAYVPILDQVNQNAYSHAPGLSFGVVRNQTPCFQFSISFLDVDGTPIIHKVCTITEFNSTFTFRLIFPNETKYFPNNTLRVELCVWEDRGIESFLQPVSMSLFVITRLDPNAKMVKKTIRPQITSFRALNSQQSFAINEAIWNDRSFAININFHNVKLADVYLSTSMFGFRAKVKVFVLVASGKMIEFGNHDALFTSAKRSSTFTLNATKAMFLRHENKFLPSDTLSLVITCSFSGHFHTHNIVEESDIFSSDTPTNPSTVAEVSKTEADDETDTDSDAPEIREENETSPPNTITQSLQDILKEGYLADFNLKAGERTFPVHKNIMGARSKFFRSMFASEMKEAQDNCVDIKDVAAETLQRMLQFIYTDRIDRKLGFADASSLYAAADFYALEPLKQGCSEILEEGLSTTNALLMLYLADLHQDRQLKSVALDFISLNDKDIIGTKDWIKFEKDNGNLALETFRELYSRKMNG